MFSITIMKMKLKVHPWRIIWRYLVMLLVIYIVILGVFIWFFFSINEEGQIVPVEWTFRQPLMIIIMLILGFSGLIPSLISYYYIVEDKYFIMKKFGKEYQFDYKNIEFIDIEESKRKKMVIFYSPNSKTRYLLGDRDGKLLETLIKKCPETMSVSEFKRRHPEERY